MKKVAWLLPALALAGCRGAQSALDPAGPPAREIHGLWQIFLLVSVIVFALVIAAVLDVTIRNRAKDDEIAPPVVSDPEQEKKLGRRITAASVVTGIVLFGLLVTSVITGHRLANFGSENAIQITVIGHQWWWEIHYDDPSPSKIAVTANEIHIPVGQPVKIRLLSRDVIHSFWVPRLNGKRDLIPGHEASIQIQADQPGSYPGQCAEFCGVEHAKMAFTVVAEPADQFVKWLDTQRAPARTPVTDVEKHGQDVFLKTSCALCHTISGTTAGASNGPDLSHVAGRNGIAAGTLPNAPGHLAGWIANPQAMKPGAEMPANSMSGDDLQALLTYLESLK